MLQIQAEDWLCGDSFQAAWHTSLQLSCMLTWVSVSRNDRMATFAKSYIFSSEPSDTSLTDSILLKREY